MRETKPKDISPTQRKGIELAVKGISKLYPFIIGYRDDTTNEQYDSAHYIDLIINIYKLSEYLGIKINEWWETELINNPNDNNIIYALWAYLKFDEEYDSLSDNPGYILQKDIDDELNGLYQYLPEQYRLLYKSNTSLLDPPPYYPVNLKVNGYIVRT